MWRDHPSTTARAAEGDRRDRPKQPDSYPRIVRRKLPDRNVPILAVQSADYWTRKRSSAWALPHLRQLRHQEDATSMMDVDEGHVCGVLPKEHLSLAGLGEADLFKPKLV